MPTIIDGSQADAYRQIFPQAALLTSHGANWQGFYLEHHYQPPAAIPELSPLQHVLVVHLSGAGIPVQRRLDGQVRQEEVRAGDIILGPAQVWHQCEWAKPGEFLILSWEPDHFAQSAQEAIAPDQVALIPQFARPDPLAHQMGLALKRILADPSTGGRLYAETLINALTQHLLHTYAVRQPVPVLAKQGLSQLKLRLVQDYIQANLSQDLSLVELATLVQMSPFYFTQQFKQATGTTPHQFVIACRVERARELLVAGRDEIADIAQQVGFAHQSHLTHHFKRRLGVTPKDVARAHEFVV